MKQGAKDLKKQMKTMKIDKIDVSLFSANT